MELRVIGAGVGRTGTSSLKLALEELLGVPCYHMYEALRRPAHIPLWHGAVRGELPDWDHLYEDFGATVDWPGAAFWEPLSAAHPDALVLLSVRASADAWFASVDGTISELLGRQLPGLEAWHAMVEDLLRTTFTPLPFTRPAAVAAYERHNERVRATVPADRLLEWQPTDGWAPLCARLEVPVPDHPFPRTNTREEFRAFLDGLDARPSWRERLRALVRR
jgi:hypothetical protein